MSKYDILFFDIDGTLVRDDHFTLSPRTRDALLAAREAGVKLAVASGRCLHILPEEVMALGMDYAVTSNGAAVYDLKAGKQIYYNGVKAEKAAIVCRIVHPIDSFIEFFADGGILLAKDAYAQIETHSMPVWHRHYFAKGNTPVVESIEQYIADGVPGLEKINLVHYGKETINLIWQKLNDVGGFNLTSSIGRSLEVAGDNCTKGDAIRFLCQHEGIELARTAGFGDSNNDEDMLRTVGCGVAMGNAKECVKQVADAITDTNEEDGVATFIEKHVL